ncbi:hypothetical protein UNDKW_0201 [Undibacterium sp. KW1]|nr:hypothetical protein UNDKW_0201 [Undibacterium sp. KW1]
MIPPGSISTGISLLEIKWDAMVGPLDLESEDERVEFVEEFGPYPIAALIHELRFLEKTNHSDPPARFE